MYAKSRFNLASNPLRISEVVEEPRDQREDTGAFLKFESAFYLHRPFKMVANLVHHYETILRPKVSTVISLRDYYDPETMGAVPSYSRENLIDGSFHKTVMMGFGTTEEYVAIPSYNPDSRIRLPLPGEHVRDGERLFDRRMTKAKLAILHELGFCDSEAPIILHGVVGNGSFSQLQIIVTNTGTEDFALADIATLTFTVELYRTFSSHGSPYNRTMLENYFVHEATDSPNVTSDEAEEEEDDEVEEEA